MIYIKDMDMPVDCLACWVSCRHESYQVTGRPEGCPLEEAKAGDLISRADAIALLTKIVFDEPPYLDSETLCRLYAEEQINTLPSAEAVHGEWIIRENGNKECSLCGHERQDGWDYFCGYCGARMTPYKGGDSE